MARTTPAEWAKRVKRWHDSGLTAKEFASEINVNAGTLTAWKYKLRREETPARASRPGILKAESAPGFLRVAPVQAEDARRTRARLEKRRGKAILFGEAAKVLRELTDENIRWIFRHAPGLASILVDKSSRLLTHQQLDYLQGKLNDLAFSTDRRDILAATLIEQYDAYVAQRGRTSTHLTSRTLFEAGVEPMYFRFMGTKLEACIGELGRAFNPAALFQSEVEPLLRHIQKVQGVELIELLEIVPRLGLKLFPHLKTSG